MSNPQPKKEKVTDWKVTRKPSKPMKNKEPKKKHRVKLYPLYSIQFFEDRKTGTLNMLEVSNIKDDTEPLKKQQSSLFLHGYYIANSNLLTKGDKEAFADFCNSYLKNLKP